MGVGLGRSRSLWCDISFSVDFLFVEVSCCLARGRFLRATNARGGLCDGRRFVVERPGAWADEVCCPSRRPIHHHLPIIPCHTVAFDGTEVAAPLLLPLSHHQCSHIRFPFLCHPSLTKNGSL